MNNKHSQEPWRYVLSEDQKRAIIYSYKEVVAFVDLDNNQNGEMNTALIVSAPKLLEALRLSRATIKELAGKEVYAQSSTGALIDSVIELATTFNQ